VKKRCIISLVVLKTGFILELTPAAYVQTNAKTGSKNDTSVMAMAVNKTGTLPSQTSKADSIKKFQHRNNLL